MKKEHRNVEKNKSRVPRSFMRKQYFIIPDRVIRGGPYRYSLGAIKVSWRDEGAIATLYKDIGFRLVLQQRDE